MGVQDPVDRRGGAVDAAPGEQRLDLILTQARTSATQPDDLILHPGRGLVGRGTAPLPTIEEGRPTAPAVALDPEAGGLAVAAEGPGREGEISGDEVVLDQPLADALGVAGVGDALAVGLGGHLTPR